MSGEDKIVQRAEEQGYKVVSEEGRGVSIESEGTVYKFKNSFGQAVLTEIERETAPKDDTEVVGGTGTITMKILKDDKVEVVLEDKVQTELANGKQMELAEMRRVVCGTDFSVESIDQTSKSAVTGKAEKYYNIITQHWLTASELQDLYSQGKAMEETLNQEEID